MSHFYKNKQTLKDFKTIIFIGKTEIYPYVKPM